jgi:hypothetical protein
MDNLNKKIRVFAFIAAMTFAQAGHPPKAHAVAGAGAVFSGVGSAVAVPLFAVGGVAFVSGLLVISGPHQGPVKDLAGFILMIIGIALLDNNGNPDMTFSALSDSQAQKLGVSGDQANIYNRELEKINLIREQIQAELLTAVANGQNVDFSRSHKQWQLYKAHISPEAYFVVEKISQQVVQALEI